MRHTVAVLLLAAGVRGQGTCTLSGSAHLDCRSTPLRTALPTVEQYGGHDVASISEIRLYSQALTKIKDGGFDACPYINDQTGSAPKLFLYDNDITTVGARAFARLAALTELHLQENAITWMAPTSLDGLTLLEELYLHENRLGEFDYRALVNIPALTKLDLSDQEGGGLSCDGDDRWTGLFDTQHADISFGCGSARSPCFDYAVACPAGHAPPAPPASEKLSSGAIGGIVVGAYLGVAGAFGAFAAYRGYAAGV